MTTHQRMLQIIKLAAATLHTYDKNSHVIKVLSQKLLDDLEDEKIHAQRKVNN